MSPAVSQKSLSQEAKEALTSRAKSAISHILSDEEVIFFGVHCC